MEWARVRFQGCQSMRTQPRLQYLNNSHVANAAMRAVNTRSTWDKGGRGWARVRPVCWTFALRTSVSRYGFRVRVWGLHEGLDTSGDDVTHCKSCVLSKAVLWTVCKEMEMENTGGNRLVHLYIHTYIHPIWILLKQETVSGSGICWATCISAPCSRQITMPAPTTKFFTGQMPFLPPKQQRPSTEGANSPLIKY